MAISEVSKPCSLLKPLNTGSHLCVSEVIYERIPVMKLSEHFESSGNWLFRWRSYLPVILICAGLASLREFKYPGGSHNWDLVWEAVAALVGLLGLAIRVDAVGHAAPKTSGRNTREQVADSLNTTGLYSIMRHPLYFGNTLMWLSVALFVESWWLAAIVLLVSALYHERIIYTEEVFLERKFGDAFRNWAARTPAVCPNFSLWKSPHLPFAWRQALQREYLGLFALITTYFVADIVSDWFYLDKFELDPVWSGIWAGGVLFFVFIRFLRKQTKLLAAPNR